MSHTGDWYYDPDSREYGYQQPGRGYGRGRNNRSRGRPAPYTTNRGGNRSFSSFSLNSASPPKEQKKPIMPKATPPAGKASKPVGLLVAPKLSRFEVRTRPTGVDFLSTILWQALQGRDHRMSTLISENQLKYVLSLSFASRIAQVAVFYGYNRGVEGISVLKNATKGIQLPGTLASYIEAIGQFTLTSGACIVPVFEKLTDMFKDDLSPIDYLQAEGRPIPDNNWAIDYEWIRNWNEHTTRPSRLGMKFTCVNYDNLEGRLELACSYTEQGSRIVGFVPQSASESEVQLGAVYKFRPQDQRGEENPDLLFGSHQTRDFVASTFWSDLVVQSFTTKEE